MSFLKSLIKIKKEHNKCQLPIRQVKKEFEEHIAKYVKINMKRILFI